jgi:hypothetical protein
MAVVVPIAFVTVITEVAPALSEANVGLTFNEADGAVLAATKMPLELAFKIVDACWARFKLSADIAFVIENKAITINRRQFTAIFLSFIPTSTHRISKK